VFRVDRNTCLENSTFPDQNLLARVSDIIQNNGVYNRDNLVAAKAYSNQHSEYRLRNLLGNILNVPNQCVVYFSVNSPCLTTCLSNGPYNIQANLVGLRNYEGIKALAFRYIWQHDDKQALKNRLNVIAPHLPNYLCVINTHRCDPLWCLNVTLAFLTHIYGFI